MPVPTAGEAVEAARDCWGLRVGLESSIDIGPPAAACVHVLMALQAQWFRYVLPSSSRRNVRETLNVQGGDASALVVRKIWMIRVVQWWLGKVGQGLTDGSPMLHRGCRRPKTAGEIPMLANDYKPLAGLR